MGDIVKNAMTQRCAGNVMELFCHTAFKECLQVENPAFTTGTITSLPGLLCRSECERHKAIWDECVAEIEKDPTATRLFNDGMQALSDTMGYGFPVVFAVEIPVGEDGSNSPFRMLDCDATGGDIDGILPEDSAFAFMLGQYPLPETRFGTHGFTFPLDMDPGRLYPETHSTYTPPGGGESVVVPCFVPGAAEAIEQKVCPFPFVQPVKDGWRTCVKPCPVPVYTTEEYHTMWTVFSVLGCAGFLLNIFMVLTWGLKPASAYAAVPFNLKVAIWGGVLYGFVETLPTMILKNDLPCGCATEECTGTSTLCAVNRAGIYILLGILINLCALTYSLFMGIVQERGHTNNKPLNALSVGVPLLLTAIAYGMETDAPDTPNTELNLTRHAFSCRSVYFLLSFDFPPSVRPFSLVVAFPALSIYGLHSYFFLVSFYPSSSFLF
jgi:hypothetical protein